jgi:WD40 repeat protein/tetratricopeptide (TPR) repeat protein
VWDLQTGQTLFSFRGHWGNVLDVKFSPDGQRLASSSSDSTIKILDARTGSEVRSVTGHTNFVSCAAFSPDGQRLASGSLDSTAIIWNPLTGRALVTLRGHDGPIRDLSFSPDGLRIATASTDRTVRLWDSKTGEELQSLNGQDQVNSVCFSRDGRWLASGSVDKTIKIRDARTSEEQRTWQGHGSDVTSVSFSSDSQRLASAGGDGTIKLWDVGSGQEIASLRGHEGTVLSVRFSPDDQRLVSGGSDQTIKIWDLRACRLALTLKGHTDEVRGVQFSPDGQRIVSGSRDGNVKIWDARTGQEILTLKGRGGEVNAVCFSPNGHYLASANSDGTFKIWEAGDDRSEIDLVGHTDQVNCAAFSADGRRLASGSNDATVKVWDVRTAQVLLTLRGHSSNLASVGFSPDGAYLASRGVDGVVKVWDAQTGAEVFTLNEVPVESVRFDPGSRKVVTSGIAENKVWEIPSGKPLAEAAEPAPEPSNTRFSPDGRLLAMTLPDFTIRLIDMRPPSELELTERRARAEFDPDWHALEARRLELDKEWFAAAFHLGGLLEERPTDANLHLRRGRALAYLQRWDQALSHSKEALRLQPDLTEGWFLRGLVYARKQRWDEALADFLRAAELDADDFDGLPWLARAVILDLRGESETCDADFEKAMELCKNVNLDGSLSWPEHGVGMRKIEGPSNPSWLLFEQQLTQLLTGTKDHGRLWRSRGLARAARFQWDDAAADFREAVKREPADGAAWKGLARACAEGSNWEDAVAACGEAAQRRHDWDICYLQGVCLQALDRHEQAIAAFNQAIERRPEGIYPWLLRGGSYAELGRWKEAAADFAFVQKEDPDTAYYGYLQGMALLGGGQYDEYRRLCQRLMDRYGTAPLAGPALVSVQSCPLEILSSSMAAQQVVSDQSFNAHWTGWTCVARPDSLADMTALLPLFAYNGGQLSGAVLCRAGRYEEAVKEWNQPTDSLSQLYLSLAELGRDHLAEAKQALASAEKLLAAPSTLDDKKSEYLGSSWDVRLRADLLRREIVEGLSKSMEK